MFLERFRQVALFADLNDDDLARVCAEAKDVRLEPGEVLFHEGDPGDRAFVVTKGEVEILKTADQRDVLLAVRGEDEVIGEMALLEEEPRSATVRARTTVDLISIPKAALDDLLATSPGAARAVFTPLIRRIRETNDRLRHQERMVQLGVMTAGVAHELNNPAAAVQRAAEHLSEGLDRLTVLAEHGVPADVIRLLADVENRPAVARSPVRLSDDEAALEEWLEDHGVADAWEVAAPLVEGAVDVSDLERLSSVDDLGAAVRFLATAASVRRSAAAIIEGAHRLSEIVRVLRSYSYLDRAPVAEVDVVRGLEDTLMLLGHATRGVRVVREYDPDLPTIVANGSELNQVWTNLIHNACDALAETGDPSLTVRAFAENGSVVVEIEDNGPGIPAELQHRVFDAFFTTKEPGKGTGLGLQISYRIIVLEHRGDLTLRSQPGRTTFRVTLPVRPPSTDAAEGSDRVITAPCEHLDGIENTPKPPGGCQECLELGDTWVHLRFCAACGKVGCCNDSKNKHAARHAASSGHLVIRTKEPGENWAWCFADDVGVELPALD